jgi:hypothetical protein
MKSKAHKPPLLILIQGEANTVYAFLFYLIKIHINIILKLYIIKVI